VLSGALAVLAPASAAQAEPSLDSIEQQIDAKSKSLVFRGTAADELSDKAEKNAKKLEKASTKMFKEFPPSAKKK